METPSRPGEVLLFACHKDHPRSPADRLRECAGIYAAENSLPFDPQTPLCRTERGKPYFAGTPFFFSVTHSGDYWVCAFGSSPLGIDLQETRPCKQQAIARRFFHPLEQRALAADETLFFSVWAAKESYVKFTGDGIDRRFSRFSTADENGSLTHVNSASLRFVPFREGYTLCVCGEALDHVRFCRFPEDA